MPNAPYLFSFCFLVSLSIVLNVLLSTVYPEYEYNISINQHQSFGPFRALRIQIHTGRTQPPVQSDVGSSDDAIQIHTGRTQPPVQSDVGSSDDAIQIHTGRTQPPVQSDVGPGDAAI